MDLQSPNGGHGSPWGDLPPELAERLLACLPLQCLARFRTVCKSWNALFSSKHFIHSWTEYCSRHPPWLVLCTPSTKIPFLAFRFCTNTWHTLSLGFLADKYVVDCKGSASGLLLVDIPSSSSFAFPLLCVCNPLTRSWISLPGMTSITRMMARGIAEAGDREGYNVVVLGKTEKDATVVEMYESSTGTWKPAVKLGDGDLVIRSGEMVFYNGCFFCATVKPPGVVAYNLERGAWRALPLPLQDVNVRHRLVVCRSSLAMVGAIEKDHVLRDLIIWEFGEEEEGWREMERMPPSLVEDFCRTSCSNWFECVGVGRYLCFRAHGSVEVVLYDMVSGSWGWLPRCDVALEDRKFLLLRSVAYQPRPDMVT